MFYFNRSEAIQAIDIIITSGYMKDHIPVFELQRNI